MDIILIALIGLLAAGYLFWRFRCALKGKNPCSTCGTCGGVCGCNPENDLEKSPDIVQDRREENKYKREERDL